MIVDDFILRQIQQIANLLAAVAGSPHGLLPDGLLEQIEGAYGDLLGLDHDLADSFDAATLGRMLHGERERDALIDLLLAHAEASARTDDVTGATRRLAKAIALMPDGDERADAANERLVELYS